MTFWLAAATTRFGEDVCNAVRVTLTVHAVLLVIVLAGMLNLDTPSIVCIWRKKAIKCNHDETTKATNYASDEEWRVVANMCSQERDQLEGKANSRWWQHWRPSS